MLAPMPTAFRDAPVSCSKCAEPMQERSIEQALVDVCPRCKGVWVDWLDGDLIQVVREIAPLSMPLRSVRDPAEHRCPVCQHVLHAEELPGGPQIWRCGECVGAFVPRASVDAIVALPDAPESMIAPPSRPSHPDPVRDALKKLVAVFKGL
jgi:Zn-finger nucleic acid-binding protein